MNDPQNDLNYTLSSLGLSDFKGDASWIETTDSSEWSYVCLLVRFEVFRTDKTVRSIQMERRTGSTT